MLKTKNVDMLSGSITKGLISMAIPIMIMNVMQNLFNVIDMVLLRMFSEEKAVGAVGACGTLVSLCTSLLIGLSAGANIVVARRVGAGKKKAADAAAMTSILLSLAGGGILGAIGVIFAEKFLLMTNCPESLLADATLYFRLYFCGVPIYMLYNFGASILRAIGDTKKPMFFLILAGAIKTSGTLVFVTVFDRGVDGVVYATIIAFSVASVLVMHALMRGQDIIHIDLRKLKFDTRELKDILFVGIPSGLQTAMYSVANVLITSTVNTFGAEATTGISIANQFDGILYHICYAPSLAVIPYVSQNVGAGNIKRVKMIMLRSVIITTIIGATFGSFSAIFSAQLSSIMSTSPTVIAYSCQKMVIISSTYFICGINEIMGGILRGMGKPIIPTISTFVYMCVFRFIWVYAIFPLCPNLTFLYLVWPIGWVLSIITLIIFLIPAISKLERRVKQKA